MAQNSITFTGNLAADPEVTKTSGGHTRARLRVAVSRSVYNNESNSWGDVFDGYFVVVCWRGLAEHVTHSLRKGDRVIVTGRLQRRSFELNTGSEVQQRHVVEIDAEEIGGSLRFDIWTRQRPKASSSDNETSRGTVAPAA